MINRSVPAAVLAVLAAAFACPAPAGAGARAIPSVLSAPASQQTDPAVHPERGHAGTKFVLELTARQRLGVSGGLRADYRVTFARRGGGCAGAFTIGSASSGARLHERLAAPSRAGWCRGHYTGTVILERGPSCSPTTTSGPPVACPAFLLAPVTVGQFSFTVV